MNKQSETGLLVLGSAVVMTAGLYIGFVPVTVAYLGVSLIMGVLGYIPLREGKMNSSVGNFALSGVSFTK